MKDLMPAPFQRRKQVPGEARGARGTGSPCTLSGAPHSPTFKEEVQPLRTLLEPRKRGEFPDS